MSRNFSKLSMSFLLFLASATNAFWVMSCPSRLLQERADPVIDPGKVSSHVHTIVGGNGFGFTMDYAQARASQCSSCPIKQDLSNYWTPTLYYRGQDGSFTAIPQAGDGDGTSGGTTVYYLQRPGFEGEKLHAFPPGFRMVAGDSTKRNFTGDFAAEAISYICLDYNGPPKPETRFIPNYNCPNGLRMQVFFPSCWDGKNLDSPDHRSHMSYPADGAFNGGNCPKSHPVHLISIFFETIFQTNLFADKWYGNSHPFVIANGDPTGYGYHGDFVNGWDVATLQQAVDDCGDNSGRIEDCSHFDFFSNDECAACKIPPSIHEDIKGPMPSLPGCNPVQPGPEPAVPGVCNDKATIGKPETHFQDVTRSKGWAYLGCGADDIGDRTFTGASTYGDDMTVERCIDYCSAAGYNLAGVEYSTECYCDNAIPPGRAPKSDSFGSCTMKCSGNKREYCGGPGAMSVYRKCSGDGDCKNAEYHPVGNATSSTKIKKHRAPRHQRRGVNTGNAYTLSY